MDDQKEIRRKRFADSNSVIGFGLGRGRGRSIISLSKPDWEMDTDGDFRNDGRHILKPKVEDETVTTGPLMKDLSLDEVIEMRKQLKAKEGKNMKNSTCNVNDAHIPEFIEATVEERKSYNINMSLGDIIKTNQFKEQHVGMLARLEHEKTEKKTKTQPEPAKNIDPNAPPKRMRKETLAEKWDRIYNRPKKAYDEHTLQQFGEKEMSMDALKILEVLAGAGNRIKIMAHCLNKGDKDEHDDPNWRVHRWKVEIFLIKMDESMEEVIYTNMGVASANKKLLAKYAAAEDLYYNLKKTKFITCFPKYYIPIVHRLDKRIWDDVQKLIEQEHPGSDIAYSTKVVVNDQDKDIPYYMTELTVDGNVLGSATHINREYTQMMAAYRGYATLVEGQRYQLEPYLKGPKVVRDLSEYRTTDTKTMTVATIPFEALSKTIQENIIERQEQRNRVIKKNAKPLPRDAKGRLTDEEAQHIMRAMNGEAEADEFDLEHADAGRIDLSGETDIEITVLNVDRQEAKKGGFRNPGLGAGEEDDWDG